MRCGSSFQHALLKSYIRSKTYIFGRYSCYNDSGYHWDRPTTYGMADSTLEVYVLQDNACRVLQQRNLHRSNLCRRYPWLSTYVQSETSISVPTHVREADKSSGLWVIQIPFEVRFLSIDVYQVPCYVLNRYDEIRMPYILVYR